MSRENFVIRLTNLAGNPVYVAVANVFGMVEVPKSKDKEAHTLISSGNGFTYEVAEKVSEISKKGSAHGILFVLGGN